MKADDRPVPLNRRDRDRILGLAIRAEDISSMSWDELCVLKHVAGDAS